jgi:hypothetical protein
MSWRCGSSAPPGRANLHGAFAAAQCTKPRCELHLFRELDDAQRDEKLIREHAERGGFVANKIAKVGRVIDPTTAESRTTGRAAA